MNQITVYETKVSGRTGGHPVKRWGVLPAAQQFVKDQVAEFGYPSAGAVYQGAEKIFESFWIMSGGKEKQVSHVLVPCNRCGGMITAMTTYHYMGKKYCLLCHRKVSKRVEKHLKALQGGN